MNFDTVAQGGSAQPHGQGEGAVGVQKRPITARDLWEIRRLSAPAISPDGSAVVFEVEEWSVEANESVKNLWLVAVSGGPVRRLTTAKAVDSAPVWSPDGRRIAFVSKRGKDEVAALYVIAVDGGEAEKILELPYAISAPKWMPDGRHLVVATSVIPELAGGMAAADLAAMRAEVKRRKETKVSAKVTEHRKYRFFDHYLTDCLATRLLKVDVKDGGFVDLTPGSDRWFQSDGKVSYAIEPDGRHLVVAMNSTPPPYREFLRLDLYRVPTDGSGAAELLRPNSAGMDSHAEFSGDGRVMVYLRTEDPCYNGNFTRMWRRDMESGDAAPVGGLPDVAVEDFAVSPNCGTLWFAAERNGRTPLCRVGVDGAGFEEVVAGGTCGHPVAAGGTVVFLKSTFHQPGELFALDVASGEVRQLTDFNGGILGELALGEVEEFFFEGAAGATVQGWLVYPPGYDAKASYPLVQVLHGGPHTMVGDGWGYRWNPHAFAAPGMIMAQVNRHGSSGFGEAFACSIVNEWPVKPFEDIMRSTDYLLEKLPNVEPQRVGVAGASYGGFLAAWILGHTDRFACIIDHAGVNNLYSQFAADGPHSFAKVFGGTPWDNPDGMQRNNPMYYAANFRTPTLVLHGELDYRVPYGAGLELYAALQAQGVASRLVVFPDENHWILKPQNSIYWFWEFHQWLARHLGLPLPEEPCFEAGEGR